jgi:hypothetical protein
VERGRLPVLTAEEAEIRAPHRWHTVSDQSVGALQAPGCAFKRPTPACAHRRIWRVFVEEQRFRLLKDGQLQVTVMT